MTKFDCVVWDFDGVLNANIMDGVFVWQKTFEQDIGVPSAVFQRDIFTSAFNDVVRGRVDLLDLVSSWAEKVRYSPGGQALLDYWFERDALPDPQMLALMDQLDSAGIRQVIATNNEARRAAYIGGMMGFDSRVETIFASGNLGNAKPEKAFFDTVRESLNVRAERLLLVDDLEANIAAATALGWQGHQFVGFDYAGLKERLSLSH